MRNQYVNKIKHSEQLENNQNFENHALNDINKQITSLNEKIYASKYNEWNSQHKHFNNNFIKWEISCKSGDTKLMVKIEKNNNSYDLYSLRIKEFECMHQNNTNNSNNNSNNHDKHESLDKDEQDENNCAIVCNIVFDKILETNMREKQENRIVMYAKDRKDVEFLNFMWTNIYYVKDQMH
eukprot:102910_1